MASTNGSISTSPFCGKTMLAPMVRVCNLGFRLLCAKHGADVVFSEEVVAAKLRQSRREITTYPGTEGQSIVEYVRYEQFKNTFKRTVVFSTIVRGDGKDGNPIGEGGALVIMQLGVASGEIGATAALQCCQNVDGFDINMGCPKTFSVSNGFGAALMKDTPRAGSILKMINAAVNRSDRLRARDGRRIPISFKTRLQSTPTETADMLREILVNAGHSPDTPVVHAITLHARTRFQRSEQAPLYDQAAEAVRLCRTDPLFRGLCFVLNGSIMSWRDGEQKRAQYGFNAVMLARAALCDPSVFSHSYSADESLQCETHHMHNLKSLLLYSMRYRTLFLNFKYQLTRAIPLIPVLAPHMATVQGLLQDYPDCYAFFGLSHDERIEAEACKHAVELVASVPLTEDSALPCSAEQVERKVKRLRLEEVGRGTEEAA